MNINASIIDQRLAGVVDEIREQAGEELGITEDRQLKSLAFVYLCVQKVLDLDHETAFDCLTEGSGDFGVDAIYLTEGMEDEFGVVLFQGKYRDNLEGNFNFEENAVSALINAVRHIFDPSAELSAINDRLKARVEEARSMIRDGLIPKIRVVACNNGLEWNQSAEEAIKRADFGDQVSWEHVNHEKLVSILQRTKPVDETLSLTGKAVFEDMNFSRVCVGRVSVSHIADLMKRHEDRLLERNIRRYLGLRSNRVNQGIQKTLQDEPGNFYFFNNGLTLVCDNFNYNAQQQGDYHVKVKGMQIVNGGQTCMTILRTKEELEKQGSQLPDDATALVRLYALPTDKEDLVLQITNATNSQNPVDLKDLKSNDEKQKQMESAIKPLGYTYHRKRKDTPVDPDKEITSGTVAEAVLSVWRKRPHQAKFFTREHFGKLYNEIFADLNGAQAVIAVLLYRIAEKHRRKPKEKALVRYASCFIAMRMGARLLQNLSIGLNQLDHRNFEEAKVLVGEKGECYFEEALEDIKKALRGLYGDPGYLEISMQQLSATFRRGDLIERLG